MQIDELSKKGLNREYKVTVGAKDIDTKIDDTLNGMKDRIRLPGFRPGKAPLSLLKKMHGDSVKGQVVQDLINEAADKVFKEKNVTPAVRPNVNVTKMDDGGDMEFTISVEILPSFDLPDFKKFSLERLSVEATEKEVKEALERLAGQQKRFENAGKTAKAKKGDAVLIDFVGKIDGEAFEGGSMEGHQLELGSGTFIPGFEDQLIGVKAGDKKDVKVTFPENYHADHLAGKEAVFEVTVKEVQKPADVKIDDEFAKSLGLGDLDSLKDTIRNQLAQELEGLSRAVLKRRLLDAIAAEVDFDVPESMVKAEFNQIWEHLKNEAIQSGEAKPEDFEGLDGPKDKKERAEYEAIAERRVRLGLVLSEAGKGRNIEIAPEEVNRRLMQEAQRFPGQEQQVMDFYRQNEGAMAQLRAPIYEEKVCAAIIEEAKVTDKKVTRDQLEKAVEALESLESEATTEKPVKKKATAKKAPAKKSPVKKAPAKKAAPKKTAAKKAPAKKKAAPKKKK